MNAKNISCKLIVTALCLLFINASLSAQEDREYIRKGNKLYKKSEFAGSEGMYRRAQTYEEQGGDAGFNLGGALYRQGRFSEAAAEYDKSAGASAGDSIKQAEGFYNLGNSLVKEQKFEESIGAYINSLKLNPDNIQAKYNLAWAQDQLKKQQEDQQKQQDQDKNQQQQQDENKDDQQDKNDQEQQQNQDDQQDKKQQDQQPSISREDAKRLLDAMAAREKETQEKVQRDKAAQAKVRVIKNW